MWNMTTFHRRHFRLERVNVVCSPTEHISSPNNITETGFFPCKCTLVRHNRVSLNECVIHLHYSLPENMNHKTRIPFLYSLNAIFLGSS